MVPNRGSLRNPGASSSSEYRLVTVSRRIAVIESGGKELWQVAERNFVHPGCGPAPAQAMAGYPERPVGLVRLLELQ